MKWLSVGLFASTLGVVAQPVDARVVKFEIQSSAPYLGGASFGEAGAYQLLRGVAFLAVDPTDPRDAVIVDIDHAPRDASGLVEFSTPFYILDADRH